MEDRIGKKIKDARERAALTQEDLAERMDVSRQAVSKWEADLSRPSSENLLRLCRMLGLDWEDLAGETEALAPPPEALPEAPEPPPPEKTARPQWDPLAKLALPVLLAAGALLLVFLLERPEKKTQEPPSRDMSAIITPEELSASFPEYIPLTAAETRDFANTRSGGEKVPASQVEAGLLSCYRFPDSDAELCFYLRQDGSEDAPYYVLFAVWTGGPERQEDYTVITSLAEGETVEPPPLAGFQALGHSGCKIVTYEEYGPFTYYFTLNETGVPQLFFVVDGETYELDIDADGENEILTPDSRYVLYDRGMDDYWAYEPELPEGFSLEFTYCREADGSIPEAPAFCLKSESNEWKSYRHFRADRLLPEEVPCSRNALTDLLCPDVSDTVFTFAGTGEMYDSAADPDLPFQAPAYPTHRQLAYMAMQTLYDLTGVKLERCYVQATDYSVYLSVDRNPNFGTFFYFDRGSRWNEYEKSIGGFMIVWKNEYAEYSPIDPAVCGIPGETEEEKCLWLYEHARFFRFGEVAEAGWDIETRLILEDGSFFEVSSDENGYSRLAGPYPEGFSH